MTSTLTLARRFATAVLTAALAFGVLYALPTAASAASDGTVSAEAKHPTALRFSVWNKPRTTRAVSITVNVDCIQGRSHFNCAYFNESPPQPTGSLKLVLKRGKKVVIRKNLPIVGARDNFGIRKLRKGSYVMVIRYAGDAQFGASSIRRAFKA